MFHIGEFSKITGLTVKTLRFYHDEGLLEPTHVDPDSGYRYYAENKIDVARVISQLRALDFPLSEIKEILATKGDDADLVAHLERQRATIRERMANDKEIMASLNLIIKQEQEAREKMKHMNFEVEEKHVAPQLVATLRIRGKYSDCGQGFAQIGKTYGRYLNGKPLMLHYDIEYKDQDADFEACMPIRQGRAKNGIDVRQLEGGRAITLLHQGPYDTLGRSYAKILAHAKRHGYEIQLPTREVYIKGPGMIFRGNPANYLTEIEMLIG